MKSRKKVARKLRTVGATSADISGYQKATTAAGNASLDSGDAVAVALRGATLDQVFKLTARAMHKAGRAEGGVRAIERELRAKYGKLNPGLARMSLGNRLRAAQ
jgi:hypothetical protein